MTLKELPIGKSATLTVVGGEGALRQHFLDMGLIQGAEVTVIKYAHLQNQLSVLPLSLDEFHISLLPSERMNQSSYFLIWLLPIVCQPLTFRQLHILKYCFKG